MIDRFVKKNNVTIIIQLILAAYLFISMNSCESDKYNSETIHIQIGKTFERLTDATLVGDSLYFTLDDSCLYNYAIGGDATLIKKAPKMNILNRGGLCIQSEDGFYRLVNEELTNSVLIEVEDSTIVDSIEKYNKYGQNLPYYSMIDCCSGEWGGTVSYVNTTDSSDIHSVESTCLLKVLHDKNSHYLLNYLAHGFGSSSVYRIGSVPDLPKTEICYQFGFDVESWTYVDSSMQSIVDGETNQLLFDTMRLELLDGYIDDTHLYLLFRDNFSDDIIIGTVQENNLEELTRFTLNEDQNYIDSEGYITEDGEVVSLLSSWTYDKVKNGNGLNNMVKIIDLKSNRILNIYVDR